MQEKQDLIRQITDFICSMPDEPDKDIREELNHKNTEAPIELLTIKECANMISGLKECTIRQLVAQGKLPRIRSGAGERGKILIPKSALIDCLINNKS